MTHSELIFAAQSKLQATFGFPYNTTVYYDGSNENLNVEVQNPRTDWSAVFTEVKGNMIIGITNRGTQTSCPLS